VEQAVINVVTANAIPSRRACKRMGASVSAPPGPPPALSMQALGPSASRRASRPSATAASWARDPAQPRPKPRKAAPGIEVGVKIPATTRQGQPPTGDRPPRARGASAPHQPRFLSGARDLERPAISAASGPRHVASRCRRSI
jgi:hypothetical protein